MYLHNLILVHYSLNKGVITLLFVGASWSLLTRLPVAEVAVQGALAHAGGLPDLRDRARPAVVHLQGEVHLPGIQRRMPSEPSTGPCGRNPLDGPLADELPLELADAAEEGEQEPPLRRRGVEPGLLERLDLGPGLVDLTDDAEEVPDGAAEPRQLRDDHDVALPQGVKQASELRPVAPRAAHLLLVDPFTPILPQLVALPVQVLVLARRSPSPRRSVHTHPAAAGRAAGPGSGPGSRPLHIRFSCFLVF